MTDTEITIDSHLIKVQPNNYKRNLIYDILRISLICLFSMVYLISNYVLDQKSVNNISEIYTHLHYMSYRPSCVRFNLLFLLNKIYDKNDCECDNLINEYQLKIQENEEIIFNTDLPWQKLKNYYTDFQQINYHDLCVGIFEAQNDFNEIIGSINNLFIYCIIYLFNFTVECHEIQEGLLGHGLKEVMIYFSNYSMNFQKNDSITKYDHLSISKYLSKIKFYYEIY